MKIPKGSSQCGQTKGALAKDRGTALNPTQSGSRTEEALSKCPPAIYSFLFPVLPFTIRGYISLMAHFLVWDKKICHFPKKAHTLTLQPYQTCPVNFTKLISTGSLLCAQDLAVCYRTCKDKKKATVLIFKELTSLTWSNVYF